MNHPVLLYLLRQGFHPKVDGYKNCIYFDVKHGFSSLSEKQKHHIRSYFNEICIREFYYENDTQYIYYELKPIKNALFEIC